MFRWQQAEGRRHAFAVIDNEHLPVNVAFQTLCGEVVTPKESDIIALGGLWFDPTCLTCEHVWLDTPVGVA